MWEIKTKRIIEKQMWRCGKILCGSEEGPVSESYEETTERFSSAGGKFLKCALVNFVLGNFY
jgi:hypothetical protein